MSDYLLIESTTCQPCQAMKRNLRIANVTYRTLNVETDMKEIQKYGLNRLKSVPVFAAVENGKVLETLIGAIPPPAIEKFVQKVQNNKKGK